MKKIKLSEQEVDKIIDNSINWMKNEFEKVQISMIFFNENPEDIYNKIIRSLFVPYFILTQHNYALNLQSYALFNQFAMYDYAEKNFTDEELKAVDNNYPLIGKVKISPNQELKLSLNTKKNIKNILIDKSLKKYSFSKNEKFIQEVLWRTYWKGWLELRPKVWTDFLSELKKIRHEFKQNKN